MTHDYHDDPALSRSDLREIYTNPALWWRRKQGLVPPRQQTKEMIFGSALDQMICSGRGPDPIPSDAIIIPPEYLKSDGSRNGRKCQEFVASAGCPCYTPREIEKLKAESEEQRQALQRCVDGIREHEAARDLMFHPDAQHQCQLKGTTGGIAIKSLPDVVVPDLAIVDLKTGSDISPNGFLRSSWNHWYDVQAAMAQKLWQDSNGFLLPVYFVCVRNTEPYDAAVYISSRAFLDSGYRRLTDAIDRYLQCGENERWQSPGHGTAIQIVPPTWWNEETELAESPVESEAW